MRKKVFFDLDGTIVDVYKRYYLVLKDYLKNLDLDVDDFYFSVYKEFKRDGMKDHQIVQKLISYNIDIEDYLVFKRNNLEKPEYLEYDSFIGDEPYSQLLKLKEKGLYIELLSQRRNHETSKNQVNRMDLNQYFDKITFVYPIKGNAKKMYLQSKAQDKDFIIGDSPIELECADATGMTCYFVETGLYNKNIIKDYNNVCLCKDYHEAIDKILNIE